MRNTHYLGRKRDQRGETTVSDETELNQEYDFSQAEQGKFYYPDAEFSFPIYLEPDVDAFITKLADEKKIDVQDLVNTWLRANIQLMQTVQ
jgi:hypothetical protein